MQNLEYQSLVEYQSKELKDITQVYQVDCLGTPAGYISKRVTPGATRQGFTSKTSEVVDDGHINLTQEPQEIKIELGYTEDFVVLEPFRQLIADNLYSPAHLWGQAAKFYCSKDKDLIKKHPNRCIQFARNIILIYHIGLQQEALYLWHNFKRNKNQVKEALV